MNSSQILSLLRERHKGDVFVHECKNGPTHSRQHLRFDAWVMPRSWANMNCLGYEIKVNRQDFLHDEKWRGYLPYCNSFYFVCPPKIIKPEELPQEVGLLWTSVNATMLYTKKKAQYRDVVIPFELMAYILMCRALIHSEYNPVKEDFKHSVLAAEVRKRNIDYRWGHAFGKRIQETIAKKIIAVESENESLNKRIKYIEKIEEQFKAKGIDIQNYLYSHNPVERLMEDRDKMSKLFGEDIQYPLDRAINDLTKIKNIINGQKDGKK